MFVKNAYRSDFLSMNFSKSYTGGNFMIENLFNCYLART